jgi:hypothetical protein
MYWIAIIAGFLALRYRETRGRWPLMKAPVEKTEVDQESQSSASLPGEGGIIETEKGPKVIETGEVGTVEVREVTE